MPSRIPTLPDAKSILEYALDFFEGKGVKRVSYHVAPPFSSFVGPAAVVLQSGFSPQWAELYADADFRKHDPVPDFVMQTGRTMSWSEALSRQTLTKRQGWFIQRFLTYENGHGASLPLVGPNGFAAYCAVSFNRPFIPEDANVLEELRIFGSVAHEEIALRHTEQRRQQISLSARERDVLELIARGKSNSAISTILEISPSSVDTYVRRCFQKLEVSDRISASLAALGLGLVRL
jgi:DNA-binding CsgD family transcriptional regulator